MFSRNLTEKEIEMIGIIEGFVREKHAHNIGHDYSHIIEVALKLLELELGEIAAKLIPLYVIKV